jgi:hypothetical protein
MAGKTLGGANPASQRVSRCRRRRIRRTDTRPCRSRPMRQRTGRIFSFPWRSILIRRRDHRPWQSRQSLNWQGTSISGLRPPKANRRPVTISPRKIQRRRLVGLHEILRTSTSRRHRIHPGNPISHPSPRAPTFHILCAAEIRRLTWWKRRGGEKIIVRQARQTLIRLARGLGSCPWTPDRPTLVTMVGLMNSCCRRRRRARNRTFLHGAPGPRAFHER